MGVKSLWLDWARDGGVGSSVVPKHTKGKQASPDTVNFLRVYPLKAVQAFVFYDGCVS
jgi:hypothetical protein